jgi:hypothetical protein
LNRSVVSFGTATDLALARSSAAELDEAWAHRQALVVAAQTLVRAAGHRTGGGCDGDACALVARVGDAAVCRVADQLADAAVVAPATPVVALDVALATFTDALTVAADAIRCCRQTAHAGAACWFAPAGGGQGCAEVLRLLHRLG